MQQMSLFDDMPEDHCQHESKVVDMGKTVKSYCERMQCWTNCRDFGGCVYEMWKGEEIEPVDNEQRA